MKPISVLLIDDNPTFLRIVQRFLQGADEFNVVGAVEGGEEALALIHRLRPDVVLTDLAMPRVSGMEAILRMRAACPKMGIIALTLLDTTSYRQADRRSSHRAIPRRRRPADRRSSGYAFDPT